MTGTILLALGAFLASAVEAVEALTIVLGVGVVRGWRSTLIGVGVALLEGLEVVFIVIAFGAAQGRLDVAIAGAAVAVALVAVVGVLVRKPLERVPENTIKYTVGVMLTSFGCFWAAEGAGVAWPGDELSLLGVVGFVWLLSYGLVRLLRRQRLATVTAGAGA